MRLMLIAITLMLATQATASKDVATLYRNSILDKTTRMHIATFDASHGEAYNWENCQIAAELFQNQPLVETKFWCEKGNYKN